MEILAPAGDIDMLRAAVYSGADCVYLGVSGFNARRGAANFDQQELAEAVAFCHARGCGVYAALNTLVFPGREKEAQKALEWVVDAGCDGVIVQDLYMARLALGCGLAVHGSTQMSVHSLEGVRFLADMGFSRAILARELSLAEIGDIAANSPIELEVFVHGALCVSVSGQCYASAFLGGRSANRGACAGTCRLPFAFQAQKNKYDAIYAQGPLSAGGEGEQYHLSLRDLSVMEQLPQLEKMGIASAKIEGRLRGPEYCAVAVDSARKSLGRQAYDQQLLQDIFSRSGFTQGWPAAQRTEDMFGVRTEQDIQATKKAMPKARELYRRERPRVPVQFALQLSPDQGKLTVEDGTHRVDIALPGPFAPANGDGTTALVQNLQKTGGTPFYVRKAPCLQTGGLYISAAQLSSARRQALDVLLARRSALAPQQGAERVAASQQHLEQQLSRLPAMKKAPQGLQGHFESCAQVPSTAWESLARVFVPLEEWGKVPQQWRDKTVLCLPRVLFGRQEQQAMQQVTQSGGLGFAGYEAGNVAHLNILQGHPVYGGFGLNVTNAYTLAFLAGQGCVSVQLSLELSLSQMQQILRQAGDKVATDSLCYGHMPLMLTRACPHKTRHGCQGCPGDVVLVDRKGHHFPVKCRGDVRTIYNPVPLWMADLLSSLPTQTQTMYFTGETRQRVEEILEDFVRQKTADIPFTRGLYTKGTQG